MSHRLGVSAVLLIAIVGFAVPVAAHDETPAREWGERIIPILEAIGAASEIDSIPEYREDAGKTAAALRDVLVSIVPEPCYLDSWVAGWVLYADLLHLSLADPEPMLVHMADSNTSMTRMAEAFTGCTAP